MGASGVVMGTRLLVAEELNAHRGYKQALVDATERDTLPSIVSADSPLFVDSSLCVFVETAAVSVECSSNVCSSR